MQKEKERQRDSDRKTEKDTDIREEEREDKETVENLACFKTRQKIHQAQTLIVKS